jgi:hypothetical protein
MLPEHDKLQRQKPVPEQMLETTMLKDTGRRLLKFLLAHADTEYYRIDYQLSKLKEQRQRAHSAKGKLPKYFNYSTLIQYPKDNEPKVENTVE